MSTLPLGAAQLEVAHYGPRDPRRAPILMLHEGLGSVSLWRDFPGRLAEATGRHVIACSRRGYGRSTPIDGPRPVDFMHTEARQVLPALRDALGLERPILFGHSDGASIALIHAGDGQPVAGVIALAPHVFVEDLTVASIEDARTAWTTTDLRARLARHHDDVDGAFRGWNDVWLNPDFRAWNIEAVLPGIRSPLLLIQGEDDEYGTLAQIDAITAAVPHAQRLILPGCRHSPHRDQPEAVLAASSEFCAAVD